VNPGVVAGGQRSRLLAAAPAPAQAPSLSPARPRSPIIVPPGRTRREGSTPPVRFPRWVEVPSQISAKLCIDPQGQVTQVAVLTPLAGAGRRAVEAALSAWRYRPVVDAGEAVAACFATTFRVQWD
jgi:hypothetical protein